MPVGDALHVFVVSLQVTAVVHVSPHVFVVEMQSPNPSQVCTEQNGPPLSESDSPQNAPDGASPPHLPVPSHLRPQSGEGEPTPHTPPGSVPAAASTHDPSVPAMLHALHVPAHGPSQQYPVTQYPLAHSKFELHVAPFGLVQTPSCPGALHVSPVGHV